MLKIIEPDSQRYYRSCIDLLMGSMQLHQNIPLTTEEQKRATFIIGIDEASNIYGGAILYKKSVRDLQAQLTDVVSTLIPEAEDVWGGTLSFLMAEKASALPIDRANETQKFYKDLLVKFIEFGHQKEIRFLCLTLNPFEHLRTRTRGFWPYILEVKPQDSLDGLFHGILPLPEKKYQKQAYLRPTFTLPAHQGNLAA